MRLPAIFVLLMLAITRANGGPITLPSATGTVLAADFNGPGGQQVTGPLPEYTYYAEGQNSAVAQSLPVGPATVVANSYPFFGPTVAVSADGDLLATAAATYYFTVNGPTGMQVPIDVSGLAFAGISNAAIGQGMYAAATATVTVIDETTESSYLDESVCDGACGSGPVLTYTTFLDGPLMITSGDEIQVQLGAVANPQGALLTEAIADPYFQIDPTFAASNQQYSLEFSSGIDNVEGSPTPEPSTVTLVFGGIGTMIFCRQKRRGRR